MSRSAFVLALLAAQGCATPVPTPSPPLRLVTRSLWVADSTHRDELDRFQDCLVGGSTFADFWRGRVTLETGGSRPASLPPGVRIGEDDVSGWLAPLVQAGDAPADVTPVYVVYADARQMQHETCGSCAVATLDGRQVGVAIVRVDPPCWPAQGPIRSLTQYTQHELSCAVEQLLGEDHCAADGACQGDTRCPDGCDNLTGLYCDGAPEQSWTGCAGPPVRGWVVQKLTTAGEGTEVCPRCATCDFTVEPLGSMP